MSALDSTPQADWRRLAADLAAGPDLVRVAQPLADLTTFRIGGPAGAVCPVENAAAARRFLEFAHGHGLPWTCLGGGSNILADDAGYAGLVLVVRTRQLEVAGDAIRVGAGWDFDTLIVETLRRGLTGLEFASGIPGTVGGALVGNAGCYGREISEFLREATVLRADGRQEIVGPDDFAFEYRSSALKGRGDVVLDLVLALARGDPAAAGEVRAARLADRRAKHPCNLPCAGSYFKNLPPARAGEHRRPAGRLLEAAGAKSMREGGAAVFAKHANIIVNIGGATSGDVLRLAARMKQAVRDRFGEELSEEVLHLATPAASQGPAVD
ncbi:MAG TPA: UDP-N-acetylmuramate dehydrogenase [Candidatus Krumholzibacteria bacterium]|nr:UDP-N-acetylmuramate dehydrogenase [Candidatus Krumholzibacteria bacterium]HPD72705.1 UDP-N-acetylmuramate dehydrogenase [Candidatus Krumholzibacteria bacterium]HRY40363.1 UDP-N-acetylmuramate dehydrogenase [Candidatus Krumholzibacteria bacterium]